MFKEKLTEAINAKNNDVNSYVWKFARDENGNQDSIRLVDATEEQLNQFYKRANVMLHNTDSKNPGRYVIRQITRDQMDRCNTELFLREYRKGTFTNGEACSQYILCRQLLDRINENKEVFPDGKLYEIPITEIFTNVPTEYRNLSVGLLVDACMDKLGAINTSHISFKFIVTHLGVFLSDDDIKELVSNNERGKYLSNESLVKEALDIKPNYQVRVSPSGLSYSEFRSMVRLKSRSIYQYSSLTTEQLLTLRNKVLFRFEQKVNHQIQQWEDIITQIRKVAEFKGYTLED
jgi:hypothetical protein